MHSWTSKPSINQQSENQRLSHNLTLNQDLSTSSNFSITPPTALNHLQNPEELSLMSLMEENLQHIQEVSQSLKRKSFEQDFKNEFKQKRQRQMSPVMSISMSCG